MKSQRFKKTYTVRFGDTDPYGVVYYVTYHRIAHQAVEDFLRSKGIDPDVFFKNTKKGIGMPVVASSGRFYKPLRYPQQMEVEVFVERVGASSLTFVVKFFNENTLVAENTLTFVSIDRNWKKIKLPEEYRRLGG